MAKHVFISYRRSDRKLLDEFVKTLGEEYTSWRDTAIRGGQRWREEIVRAIDAAYALILVVSPETEHSKEVYAEYFYALARQVPVIPLLIKRCNLPFGLENVNARLWYADQAAALQKLKEDLDHYRHKAPAAETPSEEQSYLNALQFNYLMHVENYTRMAGLATRRSREALRRPQAVVMRPGIRVRRTSPLYAKKQGKVEVRDYEDLLPALHELKRTVVVGEPGIGKTTTLYKFADDLRKQALAEDDSPLPVIVPLREWRDDTTWQSFIDGHLGGLTPRCLDLLKHGRLYFLFDGLNELSRDRYRERKLAALRDLFKECDRAVVTCRELDYRDPALQLQDFNTITIRPLDPERIQAFLSTCLVHALGEEEGQHQAEELFWQIAGGDRLQGIWKTCEAAGVDLSLFFEGPDAVDSELLFPWEDQNFWRRTVADRGNLIRLAANPYLLWMLLDLYLYKDGRIPDNRGAMFHEFVFSLLEREKLTEDDHPTDTGQRLLDGLGALAWHLQGRAAAAPEREGAGVTVARGDAVTILGDEDGLYLAASANLLEDARTVRFTHQLLQEYFAALRMRTKIKAGRLDAAELWPAEHWWERTGWEEAAVFLAGLDPEGPSAIINWLKDAQPQVLSQCLAYSGCVLPTDQQLAELKARWLPRLAPEREPAPEGRHAVALALAWLGLDDRPGVGLREDGLPDIDWVEIPAGQFLYGKKKEQRYLETFWIARYPITNAQYEAFSEEGGYEEGRWWEGLGEHTEQPRAPEWSKRNRAGGTLANSAWSEHNRPRENVTWYEAVAFCSWLSARLGESIRLPTELQWEKAARGTDGREYPWGDGYRPGFANVDEERSKAGSSYVGQTTAVGLYPQGASPYGVLDLAGNVWEWCLNKYHRLHDLDPIYGADPRVLRGGSWGRAPRGACSVCRLGFRADGRGDGRGFRLVRASPVHTGR